MEKYLVIFRGRRSAIARNLFVFIVSTVLFHMKVCAQIDVTVHSTKSCTNPDGKATIAVSTTDVFDLEYSIDGKPFQSSSSFDRLAEGAHTVIVRDKETQCSFSKSFYIENESKDLQASISGTGTTEFCNNANPPTITLTASAIGGSGFYTYSWPNATKRVSSSGRHSVTVTDTVTGCKSSIGGDVVFVPVVCSVDPNDIVGPVGYGPEKMIAKSKQQSYMIRFENDPDFATAPAQVVKINHPLDGNVNPFSLRLGDFGFAGLTFTVPPDKTYYANRLDLIQELGVVVDVTAGIDAVKKEAFWIFESKNPATGLPPADASLGFLPVNDETARGEGYVTYLIKAANPTVSGDLIHAKASIVFDINKAIDTPEIKNWIDAEAPVSAMKPLANESDTTAIELIWDGRDEAKGSGIRSYSVYVSEDEGPFTLYREGLEENKIIFDGKWGKAYCFYVVAIDNVGNIEEMKNTCEAKTFVKPEPFPVSWLYFSGRRTADGIRLDWGTLTEQDAEKFIVQRSINGRVFSDIGSLPAAGNSAVTNSYHFTDNDYLSTNAKVLYYRLKQVDFDGSFSYTSIVAVQIKSAALEMSVNAYPNPFTHHITLEIMNVSATSEGDRVELFSLDGKRHYSHRIETITGSTVLLGNLPKLSSGIYLLRTSINGKMYTLKMIKE